MNTNLIEAAIRHAFGEVLTDCLSGHELEAWRLMNTEGIGAVCNKYDVSPCEAVEFLTDEHLSNLIRKTAYLQNDVLKNTAQVPAVKVLNTVSGTDVTNADRAEWAMQAVETFAHTAGLDTDGEELEVAIGDLTTDLMHLCKQKDISFDAMLAAARRMYLAEFDDEVPVPA